MRTHMKSDSVPVKHRHDGHAHRNGHGSGDAPARLQALALALLTQITRRLVPSLRTILPSSRDVLAWQLRGRAVRRAEEQRRQERRRKIAIATTSVAVGVVLAVARALARR